MAEKLTPEQAIARIIRLSKEVAQNPADDEKVKRISDLADDLWRMEIPKDERNDHAIRLTPAMRLLSGERQPLARKLMRLVGHLTSE